jgi:hypothetical protein
MLRLYTVVGVSLLCMSCATEPPQPDTTQTVHLLRLEKPGGSSGQLRLIKKTEHKPRGNTFDIVTYTSEGAIRVADDVIEWIFTYSPSGLERPFTRDLMVGTPALGLQARNKTQDVIEIDWNRTVLVDPNGQTQRVIHQGVKIADRASATAPSIIPPGAMLKDSVIPSEGIRFESGRYGGWRAPGYFDQLRIGSRIGLTITTKQGDKTISKSFTFVVQGPE